MLITNHNTKSLHLSPPYLMIEVWDETWGKIGYVIIDRPVRGTTSGGVRFASNVSVTELASLARSMTYKWAFLNVPMGGAKAGICADPHHLGCDRGTLMEAFGRSIAPLVSQEVYHPGVDLGTTLDDLRAIMRGAGRPLSGPQIDASFCTGLTVFETIRQATSFDGLQLAGLRVAIEGMGKVAGAVAELLAQAGAKLCAVSTVEGAIIAENGLDVPRLLSLRQEHGDQCVRHYPGAQPIPLEALFTYPVDLLVPGARPQVISAGNAGQVQARLIVPISNAPMTPEAEQILVARGIAVIPDFVANCGGVLASNMRDNGFDVEDVRQMVKGTFAEVVVTILENARHEGRTVCEVARELAWQNHRQLNEPEAPLSDNMTRAVQVLRSQGLNGVHRRLAWRLYRRWPRLNGSIRRVARERYSEWGLGATLNRLEKAESIL